MQDGHGGLLYAPFLVVALKDKNQKQTNENLIFIFNINHPISDAK